MKLLLFPLAAHHYSHRGEIWLLNLESSYRSSNSGKSVIHYLKHGRKSAHNKKLSNHQEALFSPWCSGQSAKQPGPGACWCPQCTVPHLEVESSKIPCDTACVKVENFETLSSRKIGKCWKSAAEWIVEVVHFETTVSSFPIVQSGAC